MDENKLIIDLANQIKSLIITSRNKIEENLNMELILCYHNIGKMIVDTLQDGNKKSDYGKSLLTNLSKKLNQELGKGFSRSNLQNMRLLYIYYPNLDDISFKLSWSHYCELISLEDKNERDFYQKETMNSLWSVRELKRQINTSLYQRILLSDGKTNKETVLKLAKDGQIFNTPSDILKDPYVFDFLGISEKKPILEKDLEYKLIKHIEDFLLELGKGFMYVGSQQRVTLGNTHYYVDMVFYNIVLKCYVLIDLKIGNLKPENMRTNEYVS